MARLLYSPDDGGSGGAPPPAAGAQTQEPVKDAPWITMFPKSVRGDDMIGWGATGEEMIVNVRKAMQENAALKGQVAQYGKGVPASADEYTFSLGDDVKEIVKTEDLKAFQAIAHELHLPTTAAQKLVDFETTRAKAAYASNTAAKEAQKKAVLESLRTEYKDKTDAVLEDTLRFVTTIGGQELRDEMEKGMGNNPALIRAFIKLAPMFNERGAGPAGGAGTGAGGENDVDLKQVYGKSWNSMTGK